MNKDTEVRLKLNHANAKLLLEKTYLRYSEGIIQELRDNPNALQQLLDYLEITEEDFFKTLAGDKKGNISFYDTALSYTKTLNYTRQKGRQQS